MVILGFCEFLNITTYFWKISRMKRWLSWSIKLLSCVSESCVTFVFQHFCFSTQSTQLGTLWYLLRLVNSQRKGQNHSSEQISLLVPQKELSSSGAEGGCWVGEPRGGMPIKGAHWALHTPPGPHGLPVVRLSVVGTKLNVVWGGRS